MDTTDSQPIPLKALVEAVHERNNDCNSDATKDKNTCNLDSQKTPQKLHADFSKLDNHYASENQWELTAIQQRHFAEI